VAAVGDFSHRASLPSASLPSYPVTLTKPEAKLDGAAEALRSSAAAQETEQAQEDPVQMFVEAIPSVLAAGRAHLTNKDGTSPEEAPSLGWRQMPRQVARPPTSSIPRHQNDRSVQQV
jgi:hypothetical protein